MSGIEFFGGLALLLGVQTRIVVIGLALDMLGAMLFVHRKGGFFVPTGVEFALSLFGGTIALALAGSGRYSLDRALSERPARVERDGSRIPRKERRRTTMTGITTSPGGQDSAAQAYGIAPPGYRLPAATRLGAVRLQVADLARSLEWYRRVLDKLTVRGG